MKKVFYLMAILLLPLLASTQETSNVFSLSKALEYAKQHNYDYINAQTDVAIAEKRVWESTAMGLPQVEGSISNENYIDIPVTMLPDFISSAVYGVNVNNFGLTPTEPLPESPQYFPVSFGTKHNATAGVSVSQLLFSGEYLVGLKASKTYLGQTLREKVKAEVVLVEQVSKSYWLILSLEENLSILDSSLVVNQKLLEDTRAIQQAGFAEDTDVEQLDVIVSNLEAAKRKVANDIVNARAYLKFYMGIDPKTELVLTDKLSDVLDQMPLDYLLGSPFEITDNIDFMLFQQQKALVGLQVKLEQAAYLPTLSAFFSAQTNAQRDKYNFFNTSEKWYPTTVWGFKLSIPIWSSGNRYAKVQQMKLNFSKMEESEKQLTNSLQLQIQSARSNFKNTWDDYLNRKKNLDVTVRIYNRTNAKYREGLVGSFDLSQAQNTFIQANTDFTMAIMSLLQSKIELEKLLTRSAEQFENQK